jgi:hypothetical protein
MTLTALTDRRGQLIPICPSLEIEKRPENEQAIISRLRDLQKQQEFYCPHCYGVAGALTPVRLRNPENRIVHFYHPKADNDRGCPNHNPETDHHKQAKMKVLRDLQIAGLAQTVWCEYDEEIKRISISGIKRHPDLLAMMPNGALVVHEVQVSAITPEELKQRTEDYRACPNVAQVIWYLKDKKGVYTRENRMLLRSLTNVEYYRLYFRDSNALFPDYAKDTEVFEQKPASKPSDNCGYSRYKRKGKATPELAPAKLPPKINYYPVPKPVRIKADRSYQGLEAEAVGEHDGLIAVPLPAIGQRPAYMGFFKSEYLEAR